MWLLAEYQWKSKAETDVSSRNQVQRSVGPSYPDRRGPSDVNNLHNINWGCLCYRVHWIYFTVWLAKVVLRRLPWKWDETKVINERGVFLCAIRERTNVPVSDLLFFWNLYRMIKKKKINITSCAWNGNFDRHFS